MKLDNAKLLQQKVNEQIENLETKTDAEVFLAITHWSDPYSGAHLRMGIMLSLLFPAILYFLPIDEIDYAYYFVVQLLGLLIGHILAYIPLVKKFMTTSRELNREVQESAVKTYFQGDLAQHPNRLGLMIYISIGEKRFHVIWDSGLKNICDSELLSWVKESKLLIRSNGLEIGLSKAIEKLESILSKAAPFKNESRDFNLKNSEVPLV